MVQNLDQIKTLIATLYKDGNGNPLHATDGQAEIFAEIFGKRHRRVHMMACTRYGKSLFVALGVLTRIITYPEKWAIISGREKQAKIIINYILEHAADNPIIREKLFIDADDDLDKLRRERSKNRLMFRHEGKDGTTVFGEVFVLSADAKNTQAQGDSLMGMGSSHVVLDEAALISDDIEAKVFRMLGDHMDNFYLKISNPFHRNHFYTSFCDPNYYKFNFDWPIALKEGRLTEDFLSEVRGRPFFDVLYENKFPDADSVDDKGYSPLLTEGEFTACLASIPDSARFGVKSMGVDIARGGGNFNVWVVKWDNYATIIAKNQDPDLMSTVGTTIRLAREWNVDDRNISCDDSVRGDVPVVIRRHGRWVDIVPIASLHKGDSRYYSKHAGLEILSANGWTKITHAMRHKVRKELFDVITSDGRTIVTEDHSLMVGGVEKTPSELSVGVIIDTKKPDLALLENGITLELSWALGLFLAEGSISYHKKNQCTVARISNSDVGLLERAGKAFTESFCDTSSLNFASKIKVNSHKLVHALRIGDSATDFLEKFAQTLVRIRTTENGKHVVILERVKKVPIQILNGNSDIKKAFIEGYMAGDGFRNDREWKSDSTSLTLSAGIQYLYESLGWKTSVRVRGDKKNVTTVARIKNLKFDSGCVKQVRSLGRINDFVYDLETESHTFVGGIGFLVHHNSGVGGGFSDRIRELGHSVNPVKNGEKADDEVKFSNRRAQNYWRLKEWLLAGGRLDASQRSDWEELLDIKYRAKDSYGQLQIMPKAEMRKAGIMSPDCSDALSLCYDRRAVSQEAMVRQWVGEDQGDYDRFEAI